MPGGEDNDKIRHLHGCLEAGVVDIRDFTFDAGHDSSADLIKITDSITFADHNQSLF